MNRFVIDHNIANFVHRFCEVENLAERDVLRRLLVAEIALYGGGAIQLDAVATLIGKMHQEMASPAAKANGTLGTSLRELALFFEEQRRRLM